MKRHVFEALLSLQNEKNTYFNIGIFAKWSISQHRAHKQREILVGILYCKIKVPSTDTHSGNPYIDFFENLKVSNTVQVQTPYMDFPRKSQSLQYRAHTQDTSNKVQAHAYRAHTHRESINFKVHSTSTAVMKVYSTEK